MIKIEIPYDIRLVSGTALWLSDVAEKYGVSARHAASLCFTVETTLEMRVKDPCDETPVFKLTLENRRETVSVSIIDKGLPYVLSEKQREMLRAGLVSSFSFEKKHLIRSISRQSAQTLCERSLRLRARRMNCCRRAKALGPKQS